MSLFLLFSGGDEPELPDLYIRDAESGLNVPVAGLSGWDDDFLQSQTLCYGPMEFLTQETLEVDAPSAAYWCRRLSKILINLEFTVEGANCVFYPIYLDKNGVSVLGASITITATGSTLGGTNYIAPLQVLDTYGANKIQFLISSISSGTAYLRAAGV